VLPSRAVLTTLLATTACAALPAAGHAAEVLTLDGPGPDVRVTGGVDLASDGSGGLVYTKAVGAIDHVFLSRRTATGWATPQQLSTGNGAGDKTLDPKVAAFPGGGLIVTWRAGSAATLLKAAVSPAAGQPFVTKNVVDLNVVSAYDLDAAPDGSAYVSFTEAANVRAAHLPAPAGDWTLLGGGANAIDPVGILDRTPTDEAALPGGMSESDVAAYPGGAVMTWTESEGGGVTDVLTRRLTGTTVGPPVELTVDTLDGRPRAGMGDMTDIAAASDGTAHVVFRQVFTYGATDRPRDLVRVLPPGGGAPTAPQVVDGLGADPVEGSEFPAIAVSRDGAHGLVGMPRQLSFQTFASRLTGGTWNAGTRADTGTPTGASTPVAAIGDTGFGVVAWQGTPAGQDETAQVASGSGTLGAPETVSVAGAGPVVFNDTESITAAAEPTGTSHLVFAQGAAATRRVVVATVPAPPVVPPSPTPTPAPTPVPTATPGPGGGTSAPTRQSFGRTPLVRLPATVRRRSGRLSVTVRNAEPFAVRVQLDVRTRAVAGRPGVRLLPRTTLTLRAGQTRTTRPRIVGARARRVLRRDARIALRAVVRAPEGKARTVARTARVRTG